MSRLRILLLLVLGTVLMAADPPSPPGPTPSARPGAAPAPPPLDPVTMRRAEQAADAYLEHERIMKEPASADSLHALADAEIELLEAQTLLKDHQPEKAGPHYLTASEKLHGIPSDDRPRLGTRLRQATDTLSALSQVLLTSPAVDAGPTPAGSPATSHPTVPPAPPVPAGRVDK